MHLPAYINDIEIVSMVFNYCRQLTVGFIQALLMQTVLGMRKSTTWPNGS